MAEKSLSSMEVSPPEVRVGANLLRVKMVLLGSSGVGKSSLALRFSKDQFKASSPTVGCAYLTQVVCLNNAMIRFEIWDTAGQEKYHSVTPLYYRGAHAALVVYDISKRETFVRAQLWLKELEKQYIPGETVVGLVGNKADLSEDRQVSMQDGLRLAESKGLEFMETSAKSGEQVRDLLMTIAHRVKQGTREDKGLIEWRETEGVGVHPGEGPHPHSACCRVGP
ncbi:ras-related protein Rab-17-like [Anguilla rostrata]|uniref:ras-related protein Rab-17-like n=1 Tax=Anguilla rostrata TaxID=7938 RepID=UPI0030D28F98